MRIGLTDVAWRRWIRGRAFGAWACSLALALPGCATLPSVDHKKYEFPKDEAFLEAPQDREFERIGIVRSKVNFPTLDPENDEKKLCKNYYNRAVRQLVEYAEDKGGDAVIEVRSVVFYLNGNLQKFETPECSDDGGEGQILVEGVAVRWKKGS